MNDKSSVPLADIRRDFERVPDDVVRRASGFAASILADVAGRRGTMDGRIAPVAPTVDPAQLSLARMNFSYCQ